MQASLSFTIYTLKLLVHGCVVTLSPSDSHGASVSMRHLAVHQLSLSTQQASFYLCQELPRLVSGGSRVGFLVSGSSRVGFLSCSTIV